MRWHGRRIILGSVPASQVNRASDCRHGVTSRGAHLAALGRGSFAQCTLCDVDPDRRTVYSLEVIGQMACEIITLTDPHRRDGPPAAEPRLQLFPVSGADRIRSARRAVVGARVRRGDKRASGSGIPLLFPFPGRIQGTALHWDDRD